MTLRCVPGERVSRHGYRCSSGRWGEFDDLLGGRGAEAAEHVALGLGQLGEAAEGASGAGEGAHVQAVDLAAEDTLAGAAACDLVKCRAELVADVCGHVGVWLAPTHVRFVEYAGGVAEVVGDRGYVESGRDALGTKVFPQAAGRDPLGEPERGGQSPPAPRPCPMNSRRPEFAACCCVQVMAVSVIASQKEALIPDAQGISILEELLAWFAASPAPASSSPATWGAVSCSSPAAAV